MSIIERILSIYCHSVKKERINLNFKRIMENLKKIDGSKTDSELAESIGLSASALSYRKIRGTIPHEQIIKYCLKNTVPIESIYGNEDVKAKEVVINSYDNKTYYLKTINTVDKKYKISFPMKEITNNKVELFIFENVFYFIDTSTEKFLYDGLYLIKNDEDSFSLRNIKSNFGDSFIISDVNNSNPLNIEKNKLKGIYGKVIFSFNF